MKKKNHITVTLVAVFVLAMFLWNVFGNTPDFSESERRILAKFPQVSLENVWKGKFATDFEKYATDRFPMRDTWRTIKAYARTRIFAQKDNHGIYEAEGHISKVEYPMNVEMLDHAIEVFSNVKEEYLKENQVYLAIVPDKNYCLAEKNGYLSMDYVALSKYMQEGMDFANYIEIADLLEASDYYDTDSHWRQENIVDVAERIANDMGTKISKQYVEKSLEGAFRGVYLGQSALIHEADQITYLTNNVIEALEVEGASAVYDMKRADGRDPYEMFLSGNQAVVTIKNNGNTTGKRLIVFRDSFASSIAPLLAEGYSEVILVDLRYISSMLLKEFVEFENADVLFLYSTLLLNNSLSIK